MRAELNVNKLDKDDAVTKELKGTVSYKSKVDYLELVRTLSNNTKTPISFVVKVFNALSDDFKTKMLCNNPEQAQREISEIINKNLIAMLKANIKSVSYTHLDVYKRQPKPTHHPDTIRVDFKRKTGRQRY